MNESHSNRAIQILASLGKAIAYLALFLGFQLLVYLFLMLTFTSAQLLSTGTLDLLQLTRQLLDASVAVSLVSGLLTLLFLLVFFAVFLFLIQNSFELMEAIYAVVGLAIDRTMSLFGSSGVLMLTRRSFI